MAAAFLAAAALTAGEPQAFQKLPADSAHGSAKAVGTLLFSEGLVPFEVVTALLIVAVVGAMAVARSRSIGAKKPQPSTQPESATRRLFGGPVEPPPPRPVAPTQETTR
jgi:NADH-quinone oxidoreductase subunit J